MGDCVPLTDATPDAVWQQAECERSGTCAHERRGSDRREFCYRLALTPIDDSTGEPAADAEPTFVTSRDISARGIGLEHAEALPYRRVRLRAADPRLEEIGLGGLQIDVTLRWCRFVGPGRYESGGRVTRSTAPLG